MVTWKLCLAVCPLLASLAAAASAQGSPYQQQINRWVAQDALDPPPTRGLLVVGSSSIRKWERLAEDFAHYEVIQRGFGGSTMADLNEFIDDIVIPYDPAAILVYAGGNDIVAGKTVSAAFDDYLFFVDEVHLRQSQTSPAIPIFYIGITPSPARWSFWSSFSALNALIAAHAQADPSLFYIDTPSQFLATGQPPASYLFAPDTLHLSQAGYDLWTSVIGPILDSQAISERLYEPNPLTPGPGERILFDFGASQAPQAQQTLSPDANGNSWNNWHAVSNGVSVLAGEHVGNLVTTLGNPTGIGLVLGGGFYSAGIVQGGLLNPDPQLLGNLAIESATQDFFGCVNLSSVLSPPFNELDNPGGFLLTGLDRTLAYDLRFLGSQASTNAQITRYRAKGRGKQMVVGEVQTSGLGIGQGGGNGNDSTVLVLPGIRPDKWGQIFVDVAVVTGDSAFLNDLEIVVTTPAPPTFSGPRNITPIRHP